MILGNSGQNGCGHAGRIRRGIRQCFGGTTRWSARGVVCQQCNNMDQAMFVFMRQRRLDHHAPAQSKGSLPGVVFKLLATQGQRGMRCLPIPREPIMSSYSHRGDRPVWQAPKKIGTVHLKSGMIRSKKTTARCGNASHLEDLHAPAIQGCWNCHGLAETDNPVIWEETPKRRRAL